MTDQTRKKDTGEPTDNGGHFASKANTAPSEGLERPLSDELAYEVQRFENSSRAAWAAMRDHQRACGAMIQRYAAEAFPGAVAVHFHFDTDGSQEWISLVMVELEDGTEVVDFDEFETTRFALEGFARSGHIDGESVEEFDGYGSGADDQHFVIKVAQ